MKKVSLLATALTLGFSGLASANDCAPTPPAGCPKAFQGFFLGGNVGYGVGVVRQNYNRSGAIEQGQSMKLGANGVVGGINTGYNHRLGFLNMPKLGMGVEFVANWGNASTKARDYDPFGANTVFQHAKFKNAMQVRGNLFYVISELVAPKVFLGWDGAKWKNRVLAASSQAPVIRYSHSKRANGLLWGFGVDFLASRHLILGVEYAGSNLSRKATSANNGQGDAIRGSIKPQLNTISMTAKIIY